MKDNADFKAPELPIYGEDSNVSYSIEMIAELAGVDSRTVLHYQESGFIRPITASDESQAPLFDDECLRELRRIEHLRSTCEVNDAGLKLILGLLHEVEILRQDRRARRQ